MFYEVNFTMPSLNIKTVEDYKERVSEILLWQIKDTAASKAAGFLMLIQPRSLEDLFLSAIFILWGLVTLPFAIAYIAICLLELAVETLLLPFLLIPGVRIVPFSLVIIIWSLSIAVGFLGGAALMQY